MEVGIEAGFGMEGDVKSDDYQKALTSACSFYDVNPLQWVG